MTTSQTNRPALFISCAALLVAIAGTGGPVIAKAFDANNADKVDGKHAVAAGATVKQRKGKLVATNSSGQLPGNILDGKAFFPTKIPRGAQLVGYWRLDTQLPEGVSGDIDVPISFGGKMPAPVLTDTVPFGETTPNCTGTVANPTAAPGWLCVYVEYTAGPLAADPVGSYVELGHRFGGAVRVFITEGGGDVYASGTWAARAPLTATRQVGRPAGPDHGRVK